MVQNQWVISFLDPDSQEPNLAPVRVCGWKKPVPRTVGQSNVCHTASRRKETRHGSFADTMPKLVLAGYAMHRCPTEKAIKKFFKASNRLSPALRNEYFESRRSFLDVFLRSALIPRDHRAKLFFTVKVLKFLRDIVWLRGSYVPELERKPEDQDGSWCSGTVAAGCRDGFGVEFFAKRSAEIWRKGYTVLPSFGTFVGARADVVLAMGYLSFLAESSFENYLSFAHSLFPGEEALNGDADRKLWNQIINTGEDGREKGEQDAGRGRYALMRELMMGHLECDGERVWARRKRGLWMCS